MSITPTIIPNTRFLHGFILMLTLLPLCCAWSGCDWSEYQDESAALVQRSDSDCSTRNTVEALPPPETFFRTFGDSHSEWARVARQTSDGGYVICLTSCATNNMCSLGLIRVDRYGHVVWMRTWGDAANSYTSRALSLTVNDGIIVSGTRYVYNDVRAFVLRTDRDGSEIFFKVYPSTDHTEVNGMSGTDDGGFVLAGFTSDYYRRSYYFKINSLGECIWEWEYGGETDVSYLNAVTSAHDGGFVFCGTKNISGYNYILVLKTDSEGSVQWSRVYGYPEIVPVIRVFHGLDIKKTDDGGYIIGAEKYENGSLIYILKIDGEGNESWVQEVYGTEYYSLLSELIQTSDGGYLIAGIEIVTPPYSRPKAGYFKRDALGRAQWSLTIDGYFSSYLKSVQEIENGGFILCGTIEYSYDHEYYSNHEDIILLKTDSQGYY